jgi:Icc-related predicted phosphoesterase
MRIALMSDTHLMHRRYRIRMPEAEMVIHSGDATWEGKLDELANFAEWFRNLPYKKKIFVAGNHDEIVQKNRTLARSMLGDEIIYLEDDLVEIGGLRIYGSPWQPAFGDLAFNLPRGEPLKQKWYRIPRKVDVLVTHGPPLRIMDLTSDGEHVGCGDLYEAVVRRVKPRVHVFGHVHNGYGIKSEGPTLFVNAAISGMNNKPTHGVIVVDVDPSKLGEVPKAVVPPAEEPLDPIGTPPLLTEQTPPLW